MTNIILLYFLLGCLAFCFQKVYEELSDLNPNNLRTLINSLLWGLFVIKWSFVLPFIFVPWAYYKLKFYFQKNFRKDLYDLIGTKQPRKENLIETSANIILPEFNPNNYSAEQWRIK